MSWKKKGASTNVPPPPWSHLVDIPERYNVRGYKQPKTHLRGISIRQLEELSDLINQVLDSGFEYIDEFTKLPIKKETLNLYHLNTLFIKPLTMANRLYSRTEDRSFAELVATKSQVPTWFVSHWWGTPFQDTLRMLRLHSQHRGVDPSSQYYWICAFANNQHCLEELGTLDYLETPFAKAIMNNFCDGTVVLLTERTATPFERSWCIFEAFISLTHAIEEKSTQRHLMDFCTIVPERECQTNNLEHNERCACLLYENYSSEEKQTSNVFMGQVTDHVPQIDKSGERRAWFPSAVSRSGFFVDIMKAKASRESDQDNILKWVGDRVAFVNNTLQRRFVRPAIYMAATHLKDIDLVKQIMEDSTSFLSSETAVQIANEEGCVQGAAAYVKESTGHHEILKYLLSMGCDPDAQYEGQNGLRFALRTRHYDNVRVLLQHGADPGQATGDDGCIRVLKTCPEDIVILLQGKNNEIAVNVWEWNSVWWKELSEEAKEIILSLGYTQELWDGYEHPKHLTETSWADLTKKQRDQVTFLGFTETDWYGESPPGATARAKEPSSSFCCF